MKLSKNLLKIIITSVIMAVTLSSSVGYAVLSDELNIEGNNNANTQSGIFITDAKIASNVGADLTNSSVTQNGGCILTVNSALSGTNADSTLTYSVTFYNSTDDYYVYNTNSSTRTNKDYVTYNISKITKKETIIPPKGHITCNMIYKYTVDPTTSNITTSDGIVTFTFTKCYKVTYENFSSTTSYAKYANPYDDFTVTLDNSIPVAVEVNDTNLSINNFTMSNNKLTVGSTYVTGDLHIRKKSEKRYNNLLKNGSFENSSIETGNASTGWAYNADSSYWTRVSSALGTYAACKKSCSYSSQHIKQNVTLTKGNIYYFYYHAMADGGSQSVSSDISKDGTSVTGNVSLTAVTGANGGYKRASSRFSFNNTTASYSVNIAWNANTYSLHIDGVGVINLTAVFGAGEEPTKERCDKWINVYSNTQIVTYA